MLCWKQHVEIGLGAQNNDFDIKDKEPGAKV